MLKINSHLTKARLVWHYPDTKCFHFLGCICWVYQLDIAIWAPPPNSVGLTHPPWSVENHASSPGWSWLCFVICQLHGWLAPADDAASTLDRAYQGCLSWGTSVPRASHSFPSGTRTHGLCMVEAEMQESRGYVQALRTGTVTFPHSLALSKLYG